MKKTALNIAEWGKLKAFTNDELKDCIGLDLETIDNKMFLLGTYDTEYNYTLKDFDIFLFDVIIKATQENKHIATWTRYDNTHILKIILEHIADEIIILDFIQKVGKISAKYNRAKGYLAPPLLTIKHKSYTINVENVIRNCIMFRVFDKYGRNRVIWSYDIKNLYVGYDLLEASKDNNFNWYSKVSDDAHIIDKDKFYNDPDYKEIVLLSNKLDSKIAKKLAIAIQEDFFSIFNSYPLNLISAGSLARSSVIAMSKNLKLKTTQINISSYIDKKADFDLLDYAMKAYHGGKIDSYILGYTPEANIVDISSAYPSILKDLESLVKSKIIYNKGKPDSLDYAYMFVKCNLHIKKNSDELSTPYIIKNPFNNMSNVNPYGYIKDIVITKFEYDFVLQHSKDIDIEYIDYYAITKTDEKLIYNPIILELYKLRLEAIKNGKPSIDNLLKTIINSLYGITYELTPLYDNDIKNIGFRAGDFFNPIIASHITGGTRTKLSEMNNHIINRGGSILLNMTDSIIYKDAEICDLCKETKIIGEFELPKTIKNVLILGSGRYEYIESGKYRFKTRGFTAKTSDKSFYTEILANDNIIENREFVTFYKSTLKEFNYKDIGLIYDNVYSIDPFNLGGKRIIMKNDFDIDLSKNMIKTKQVYLDEWL